MNMSKNQKKVFINGKSFMVGNKKELDTLRINIEKSNEKIVAFTPDNKKQVHIKTDNVFNVKRIQSKPIPIQTNKSQVPNDTIKNTTVKQTLTSGIQPGTKPTGDKPQTLTSGIQPGTKPTGDKPQTLTSNNAHKSTKIVAQVNVPSSQQPKKVVVDDIKYSKPFIKSFNKPKNDDPIVEDEDTKKFNIKRAAGTRPLDPKKQMIIVKKDDSNVLNDKGRRNIGDINVVENDPIEEEPEDHIAEMQKYLNTDEYFEQKYDVMAGKWYSLVLKLKDTTKEGLLKILDIKKHSIYPLVKLPNILYCAQKKAQFDDLQKINDYRIYFKTPPKISSLTVYAIGITFSFIKLQEIPLELVRKSIDLWKLRKHYDLELTNYYLNNIPFDKSEKENPNHKKFVDKFKADYELYKDSNLLDKIDFGLDLTLDKNVQSDNQINVLYLTYSSIEYESYGYTVRTHNLLQNGSGEKYKLYGCTMYGYPYNRDTSYYDNRKPSDSTTIDDVTYIKLLDGTDNIYTNNLVDFLKKYVVSVIKLAHKLNVKVIHAASNFWNGIAAVYAAKYLGIKSMYEIRGFWDEATIAMKPELKNSDYLKMMINLEMKIFNDVDLILTINQPLHDRLLEYKVDDNKIKILYNGVNTEKYKPNEQLRNKLRGELQINSDEIVIGYIGSISDYEGIEYILECVKQLIGTYPVKFVIIGDGMYKDNILSLIKTLKLTNNVIHMNKMNANDVVKYYNVFDIVAYPRKDNCLCQSTSSYKVFEAMSMAKPIIVSDLLAWKEIIQKDVTGLYCQPDSVDGLLKSFVELIQNPTLRSNLGNSARKWVIENREWSKIGNDLRSMYTHLLNGTLNEKVIKKVSFSDDTKPAHDDKISDVVLSNENDEDIQYERTLSELHRAKWKKRFDLVIKQINLSVGC